MVESMKLTQKPFLMTKNNDQIFFFVCLSVFCCFFYHASCIYNYFTATQPLWMHKAPPAS